MSDRSFGRPRSDGDRRSPEMPPSACPRRCVGSGDAWGGVRGCGVNPLAFCWGGHPLPELEEPGLSGVVGGLGGSGGSNARAARGCDWRAACGRV